MGGEHTWEALSPDEANELFGAFSRPWWVAGGWAVDLFLGRQTRGHEDIDVAMLRGDEVALASMLPGWDICIAEAGELIPWDGRAPVEMPHHQFWVRRERERSWTFEVLLEEHDGVGTWRYRRDHRITMPLERFGSRSGDGIPYVAPEVALLYKASRQNANSQQVQKNDADLAVALPSLEAPARVWLRAAVEVAHPGHPWLELL